jgi:tetratricopeptide (TPR) repeat protein
MVRRSIAVLAMLTALAVSASAATTPDVQLDLGLAAFRAGDYTSSILDLGQAAQGLLTEEELQVYIDTGRSDRFQPLETALVYLALSQFRQAQEDDARDTILRLLEIEKLAPTYVNLPLQSDAAEFETLVAALVPGSNLPTNAQLGAVDPTRPLPSVTPVAEEPPPPPQTTDAQLIARQAAVNTYLAFESERMEREAMKNRLAAPVQPAPVQTAQATPPPEPREEPTILSVPPQPETLQRQDPQASLPVTPEPTPVQPTQRREEPALAETRIEPQPTVEPPIVSLPPEPEPVQPAQPIVRPAPVQRAFPEADSATIRGYLTELRQAEAFGDNGLVPEAEAIYTRLINTPSAPREVIAAAAVGLYRTGSFPESVEAFRRLGVFARGEEDLRYYHAVSLYEIGEYAAAQKELACALPFIELTDEVARYRLRIEQMLRVSESVQQQAFSR